jgi:serine/threonine protein kinase
MASSTGGRWRIAAPAFSLVSRQNATRSSSSVARLILAMFKRLKSKYLKCPLSTNRFLPLDVLDEEITEENVRDEIPGKLANFFKPHLPSTVVRQAKKVFTILVIVGEPQAIKDLLAEGITDEDLPLSRRDGDEDDNNLVSCSGKVFSSFADWKDEPRVEYFLDKQWTVLAPVLDFSGSDIKLSMSSALPFEAVDPVGHNNMVTVYKSDVHPAHQRGLQTTAGKYQVAAKEFGRLDAFDREKENLIKIQNIRHQHLVQHLATWDFERKFYIIFPWANGGNLMEFWKHEDQDERSGDLTLWSIRQMLGITSALQSLHQMNCRHGDLKPENILHFIDEDRGALVVADVGVSKVHKEATMLRQGVGTGTRATTPAYEAPETLVDDDTPRSRLYDIWSLGCVFLEYVIWLLEDVEAIDRFRNARDGANHEFYVLPKPKGRPAVIHPTVYGAIDTLRQDPRCKAGTALGSLVNLIADHMLQIEVDRRDTADSVVEKLRKIVAVAEQDPSYLFNEADSDTPEFDFLPRKAPVAYEPSSATIPEDPSEPD